MAEEKKYNWANWDIREQPKIELEDIPEEPKPKRTATQREKEIGELRYNIMSKVTNELERNNYYATKEVFDKGIVKSNIKVYGRFRSYLMNHKSKIILSITSFVFLGLWIMLLVFKVVGFSLEPTGLFSFLAVAFLLASFFFTFLAVEGD